MSHAKSNIRPRIRPNPLLWPSIGDASKTLLVRGDGFAPAERANRDLGAFQEIPQSPQAAERLGIPKRPQNGGRLSLPVSILRSGLGKFQRSRRGDVAQSL
jgi:hypothetical protein